jgi:hypothetical protein
MEGIFKRLTSNQKYLNRIAKRKMSSSIPAVKTTRQKYLKQKITKLCSKFFSEQFKNISPVIPWKISSGIQYTLNYHA